MMEDIKQVKLNTGEELVDPYIFALRNGKRSKLELDTIIKFKKQEILSFGRVIL